MEILPNIKIENLAIILEKQNILILSDLHIGYEEALNKEGLLVPRFQYDMIVKQLNNIFSKQENFNKIIINGDLKHEFGEISFQEWRDTLNILDLLEKHCDEIILIKGNHDTILGPIADKKNILLQLHYIVDDILITHGDKIIKSNAKTIIIGHEHPAISLKEDIRAEKYKCFLIGKYKQQNLIVMPSFNQVTEGTDILREQNLSPYLNSDLSNFRIIIVADKLYDFGKIKTINAYVNKHAYEFDY